MKKKTVNRKCDASVTVEASFIIPLIFFAVLALVFLCMFEYNRVRLQSEILLARESIREICNREDELVGIQEMENTLSLFMAEGFMFCETESSAGVNGFGNAELSGRIRMKLPDTGVFADAVHGISEFEISRTITYSDRERILRLIAIGTQTWEKVVK